MLKDRVAIVTGGGSGMGEATASLFADQGAHVVIADKDGDNGNRVRDAIVARGGSALFVPADVSDEMQVSALVAATVAAFGRLDCAVNNAAGAPDDRMVAEADLAQFDRVIMMNLRSVMVCMKYQIRQMMVQGAGGAIVNIGSVSSERARRGNAAYVAAKHGVVGLTRTAALEYAGDGIRVNAVLPGTIDTPMLRRSIEGAQASAQGVAAAMSLFGRFGQPEEVAQASLWLCSGQSSYVTGQALAVDAGYLIMAP